MNVHTYQQHIARADGSFTAVEPADCMLHSRYTPPRSLTLETISGQRGSHFYCPINLPALSPSDASVVIPTSPCSVCTGELTLKLNRSIQHVRPGAKTSGVSVEVLGAGARKERRKESSPQFLFFFFFPTDHVQVGGVG